jgi:dethiobiotin synthetase
MSTLCCFRSAKAPYFAARDEGARIDVNRICRKLDDLTREQTYTHVVMEGAGGLLVPVTADRLVVDIMQSLQAHVILVGRAGLGTINHTLLSVEALERRGLKPKGIVLISKGTEGSDDLVRENMEAIGTFSGIRPAGVIGPIRDFVSPGDGAYDVVETLLSQTMRKDHAGKRDIGHR